MCRDVGVTTTTPAASISISASTMTVEPSDDAATVNGVCTGRCLRLPPTAATAVYTQTTMAVTTAYTQTTTATVAVDTPTATVAVAKTVDVGTQSTRTVVVRTNTVGVTARPRMYDACVATKPAIKHVACSTDSILKPVVITRPPPVSRTTQTDTEVTAIKHVRGTQTTPSSPSPAVNRTTQTDVSPVRKENGSGGGIKPVATAIGRRSNSFHHYTAAAAKDQTPSTVTSKIPRLKPVTPELNRKVLMRQDTYTKTVAEVCEDQQTSHTVDNGDDDDDDDRDRDK